MAHRGVDTLRFGPMKPVGLIDPRTGRAAVCRGAAAAGQPCRRPLQPGRIPDAAQMGRAGARAAPDSRARAGGVRPLRHGAPQHVRERPDRARRNLAGARAVRRCFSPGQMSGVEGYVESAASGLLAGLNAAALATAAARRRRRGRRRSARWRITRRMRIRRTTSHRTSRSGSWSRSAQRRQRGKMRAQAGAWRSRAGSMDARGHGSSARTCAMPAAADA